MGGSGLKDLSYIQITPELKRILDAVKTEKFITVTGVAGVGKSELINILAHHPDYMIDGATVYSGTTGVAAVNITDKTDKPASTLHRAMGFGITRPESPDDHRMDMDKRMFFKKEVKRFLIDEVSMLTSEWFQLTLNTLLRYHNIKVVNEETIARFPIQIIILLDPLQLCGVTKDYERIEMEKEYGTDYFFGSHLYKELDFKEFALTKSFRTTNLPYLNAINKFRVGAVTQEMIDEFNKAFVIGSEDEYKEKVLPDLETPYTTICATNKQVNAINQKWLDQIDEPEVYFKASTTGEVSNADKIVPDEIILKVGAKVMIRKNDSKGGRYVNGTIGVIESLPYGGRYFYGNNKEYFVQVRVGNDVFPIYSNTWEVYDATGEVEGLYSQIPLTVCYAITAHKSQGLGIEYMLVDSGRKPGSYYGGFFANGQTYTVLSRSSNPQGMRLLKPLTMKDVKVSKDALQWYNNIIRKG